MIEGRTFQKAATYFIASVWIVNGLFCKVLNLVPRHKQIVAEILNNEYAAYLTKIIGIAEIFMAIWIFSGIKPRLNAFSQIIIVATMNILEFLLVPDLLLFGRLNAVLALIFICFIYFRGFGLNKTTQIA